MVNVAQTKITVEGSGCRFSRPSFILPNFKTWKSDEHFIESHDTPEGLIPPMSLAFSKARNSVYAMCDEEGGILIGDVRKTGPAALSQEWMGHSNAIFSVDWVWGEDQLVTASGDKTLVLWDVFREEKLTTFTGHSNSVKTLCFQPHSKAVFASGARDGHVYVWDARVQKKSAVNMLKNPHAIESTVSKKKKQKSQEDSKQSVTCVLYQDENTLISSGSIDGQIKVWDMRKLYSNMKTKPNAKHIFPYAGDSNRSLGFSNMVFDSSRTRLFCSCRDHVIYQYDCAAYTQQPVSVFRGHTVETYYVQMSLSPDDSFLLSGSSDANAYIWEVDDPAKNPVVLKGHSGEVCSVAWSPVSLSELVTTSDDGTLRVWRVTSPTETTDSFGQFVGTAAPNSTDCSKTKGYCRLVPDPTKCMSSQHTSPVQAGYSRISSPVKTSHLLMSPSRGTTLPHSPAKISSAVKHALRSMNTDNSQGCFGSKKTLVNSSITRWFNKSSHNTAGKSPRKLIITPKKSQSDQKIAVTVQHYNTPHRVKGVKRKLADIYEEPGECTGESHDSNNGVKRSRPSENPDRVLKTVCENITVESNTELVSARQDAPNLTSNSEYNSENCGQHKTVCENATDTSHCKNTDAKEILLRKDAQCIGDVSDCKYNSENIGKHKTPLKMGLLLGGHKTPLKTGATCCSSPPPPQYHSPTVDLPNYVMNPEPRTPVGRNVTLTPNQTPDWLTSLRKERDSSSVKKEEGDTPVRKVRATPRSVRRANKSIVEFFSPKDTKK